MKLVRVDLWNAMESWDETRSKAYATAIDKDNVGAIKQLIEPGKCRYSLQFKATGHLSSLKDTVRECCKDAHNAPYIPGSTLKGAIRTALFWSCLGNHKTVPISIAGQEKDVDVVEFILYGSGPESGLDIGNFFQGSDKKRRWSKNAASIFEGMVFFTGNENMSPRARNFKQRAFRNPQEDLLKFLIVSDLASDNATMHVDNVLTYSRNSRGTVTPKSFSNLVEVVEGDFHGSIHLSPQIRVALKNRQKYPTLGKKLSILGLEPRDIDDMNAAEKKMVNHVMGTCAEYTANVKKFEREVQGQAIPHPNSGTIRLGFGVGTLYQTIVSGLTRAKPRFVAELASIISRPNRRVVSDDIVDPIYPKTYELLESSELPPGWLDITSEH